MNSRLIFVVGPSGAGKDSLLRWLMGHARPQGGLHLARRCITRAPADAGDEQHEALTPEQFEHCAQSGAFALDWRAHGLGYGIRHGELAVLASGGWLMVNGSRAAVTQARERFPGLTLLHLTASPQALVQRLQHRARESAVQVQQRLQRALEPSLQNLSDALEVRNDASLQAAGLQALQGLGRLPGWVSPLGAE
jgi:ribose 1,5-bisphosphokinase